MERCKGEDDMTYSKAQVLDAIDWWVNEQEIYSNPAARRGLCYCFHNIDREAYTNVPAMLERLGAGDLCALRDVLPWGHGGQQMRAMILAVLLTWPRSMC